jgi:hypothetical protein
MILELIDRNLSKDTPHFWAVPAERFSTTTSAIATRRPKSSRPGVVATSIERLRTDRLSDAFITVFVTGRLGGGAAYRICRHAKDLRAIACFDLGYVRPELCEEARRRIAGHERSEAEYFDAGEGGTQRDVGRRNGVGWPWSPPNRLVPTRFRCTRALDGHPWRRAKARTGCGHRERSRWRRRHDEGFSRR